VSTSLATGTPIQTMSLMNATYKFSCKSTLKLQNRTAGSQGDTYTDIVDNQPIYGKFYEGNGLGSSIKPMTKLVTGVLPQYTKMPLPSTQHGLILEGDEGRVLMREPPNPKLVTGCKTSGKAKLEPGEIKTSTISYDFGGSLDKLWSGLNDGFLFSTDVKVRGAPGKFKIFAFEKMIHSVALLENNAIQIGYELNQDLACAVQTHFSTVTAPDFATSIA